MDANYQNSVIIILVGSLSITVLEKPSDAVYQYTRR